MCLEIVKLANDNIDQPIEVCPVSEERRDTRIRQVVTTKGIATIEQLYDCRI